MCLCDAVQPLQLDGLALEKFYGLVYVVVSHCGTRTPPEIIRLALSSRPDSEKVFEVGPRALGLQMRLALLCIHKCKIEATIRAELLLSNTIKQISDALATLDRVSDSNYFSSLISAI